MSDTLSHTQPSSQADGHADQILQTAAAIAPSARLVFVKRRPQPDPLQTAIDELTSALIKAAAIRQHLNDPEQIPLAAYEHFRRLAGVALHLAFSGDTSKLKAEALRELADEYEVDLLGKEMRIGRSAIETFMDLLWKAGEREVRG